MSKQYKRLLAHHFWRTGKQIQQANSRINFPEITQQKLASESGVPSTTISEWIGKSKKSETGFREPGITRFHKVAKALGVSMDYLLGEKECEIPDDEQIHTITGLSGTAIKKLKELNRKINQDSTVEEEKKLAVLNCLISNMDNTTFRVLP